MQKLLPLFILISSSAFAGMEIKEEPHSISAELDGRVLWTYHHDPAEGKPYIHPLASTDGTVFTALRPEDHPWHRGVWFSWKFINGVNYWEEDRKTGRSDGETRIITIDRKVTPNKDVYLKLDLEYAPAGSGDLVLKEKRTLHITPPDQKGLYLINWSSRFQALENDVLLDRTPPPDEPNGKEWGGYAGWSVRMNKEMVNGNFYNSAGTVNAIREVAESNAFQADKGGGLLFKTHPDNINHPPKWYIAQGMPYFSPAVIFDAPYTIKAGESLTLKYTLLVAPGKWIDKRDKVVILTGANNHAWQKTTPVLKSILEESGNFDVDVVSDPEKLTAEFLSNYDVLLSNWNGFGKNKPAPWSDGLKMNYVDFVRNGGGHVVVHAGSSSFYDWDDYQAICLATWKEGTGHKKSHEFDVRISKPVHPVVQGLENFKTTDELWFKPFVQPDATVLAESYSQHTGNWEPTAFIKQFGEGRCFTLLLGHSAEFMQNDGFKELLIRGSGWAGGK